MMAEHLIGGREAAVSREREREKTRLMMSLRWPTKARPSETLILVHDDYARHAG